MVQRIFNPVLNGVECSASRPGRFAPGEGAVDRYPLDRRLGGPRSQSGRGGEEKKTPAPTGNRSSVIQPVA
jgi:hypothetical protein